MAWTFFGCINPPIAPEYMSRNHKAVYGPLPRKRWIKSKSDKKHKLSYKFSYKRGATNHEEQARSYAIWLAARDGITISGAGQVQHDFVRVDGRNQRRACAVHFGSVRINIPNWDFVPAAPVEETIDDDMPMLLAA